MGCTYDRFRRGKVVWRMDAGVQRSGVAQRGEHEDGGGLGGREARAPAPVHQNEGQDHHHQAAVHRFLQGYQR